MQITVNGTAHEMAERITVARLLDDLKLLPKQVAVEVNRDVVPRSSHEVYRLSANDSVEIVTLVGGG